MKIGLTILLADNQPPESEYTIIQELDISSEYREPFTLEYCGDIDQDNKPDMIISTCSTQGCSFVLFLSSKAKENELLGKVSSYSFGSNC